MLAALAGSLGCATRSLQFRDWVEIRTPHFEIVSSLSAEATLELAGDVERFRSAAATALGVSLPAPAGRIRVYAFDGRGLIRPFDVGGAPGYFLSTLRGRSIVLRTGDGWRGDATARLRHEYAHELFRSSQGLERPLWYDEGIAQLASTIAVNNRGAEVGAVRMDHVQLLRERLGLSVERLVQRRDLGDAGVREREIFSAESWAFVHLLMLGRGDWGRSRSQLSRYFALLERGVSPTRAFSQALGADLEELEDELFEHVRREKFRGISLRDRNRWRGSAVDLRPLLQREALARLGWLSIDLGRSKNARRYFEMAGRAGGLDAGLHAGLAAAERLGERWEQAQSQIEQALALAAGDPIVQLEAGRCQQARAEHSDDAVTRAQLAERAREHYARSLELDDSRAETHAMLGATYLLDGEDAARGAEPLRRARELDASSLELDLLQARLSLKLGRRSAARYLALNVDSRTHSRALAARARQLLDEIDE